MIIQIKYTNLNSTPAMNDWVEKKLRPLEKLLNHWEKEGKVIARVEIARTTNHHNKGEIFRAEVNLDLAPNIVTRADHKDVDARTAVDIVQGKLEQELKKINNKTRPQDSGGQKQLRKLRGKE
ncbi:MAG: ribosome-associated translation inhibitor RaiA [Patescibacteria group bacterium]